MVSRYAHKHEHEHERTPKHSTKETNQVDITSYVTIIDFMEILKLPHNKGEGLHTGNHEDHKTTIAR